MQSPQTSLRRPVAAPLAAPATTAPARTAQGVAQRLRP